MQFHCFRKFLGVQIECELLGSTKTELIFGACPITVPKTQESCHTLQNDLDLEKTTTKKTNLIYPRRPLHFLFR